MRINFWYADDKLKDLADAVIASRKSDEKRFIEALSQYSDYLREISYEDGKDSITIDYEESW